MDNSLNPIEDFINTGLAELPQYEDVRGPVVVSTGGVEQ